MQSYPLDLTTILYLLDQQQQSGVLQAALADVPGTRETCQARLKLIRGKVMSCVVETSSGRLYVEGRRALTLLAQLGTVEWVWKMEEEGSVTRSLPAVQPGNAGFNPNELLVPRRREPLRVDALQRCSRAQRRVLGLVDGRRTVKEIATILSVPPTEIPRLKAVMRELEAMELLSLERY
jgi:hypothetical protein